ncbi:hypothetical protein QJS66_15245 [Kocuria rhizophila]|nr:hypothetical protein QJS66_15245 [Kocuria rhizophila]
MNLATSSRAPWASSASCWSTTSSPTRRHAGPAARGPERAGDRPPAPSPPVGSLLAPSTSPSAGRSSAVKSTRPWCDHGGHGPLCGDGHGGAADPLLGLTEDAGGLSRARGAGAWWALLAPRC